MFDATDEERFPEVSAVLDVVFENIDGKSILICANKLDKNPKIQSNEDIIRVLDIKTSKNVMMCFASALDAQKNTSFIKCLA